MTQKQNHTISEKDGATTNSDDWITIGDDVVGSSTGEAMGAVSSDIIENKKSRGGRPTHVPNERTRKMVLTARGMGLEQIRIAALLDIDPKTLRKFYRRELDTGVERANLSVATALHKRATSGKDTIASIFWMKARAGWVDTVRNVHEGLPEKITVSFAMPSLEDKSAMIDVTPEPDKE
jgi:hypothetical protein